MRSPHILLFVLIFAFAAFTLFSSEAAEKPEDEGVKFLTLISKNDYNAAMQEFGDNTCHCAPKGGYGTYLHGYAAAQEPNIEFMLGQPVSIGKPQIHPLPYNGSPYMLPWDRPEDALVYIPVEFTDTAHRPYFLPLDTAFGFDISEKALKDFDREPKDWMKALTLRLRSSLAPGTIKPKDPKAEETDLEKAAREGLMSKELTKYIRPADPGKIILASGKSVPLSDYENQLPRLKSCEVGLKIVRRGHFSRWTVKKLGVVNVALAAEGKIFNVATERPTNKPPESEK